MPDVPAAAPLTDADLAAMAAHRAAARPGPLVACIPTTPTACGPWVQDAGNQGYHVSGYVNGADASFDAYARTDLPRLLAEVARLRAALRATGRQRQFGPCWCDTLAGVYCVGQPQCREARAALGEGGDS